MNIKKVLCLALTLALAVSAVSISAFAAPTTPTATISISASKTEEIEHGEAVTITVAAEASEDFWVGPVGIPVTYDKTLFEASNVVVENIFGEGTTEESYYIDTESDETLGKVTVVITPDTAGEPVAPNLKDGKITLFTFTLTAIETKGSCDVAIVNDQKTFDHTIGTLYMGSFDGPNPREAELSLFGQTLILEPESVNLQIGSAADPVLKGIDTGYVDDVRTYVYGVPAGTTDLTAYFEVENGTFKVEGEGTGATLTVYTLSGEPFETYTVIIFGDVNGDNAVNASDATIITLASRGTDITDPAQAFAADVNGDGAVNAADATIVTIASRGGAVSVNPYVD